MVPDQVELESQTEMITRVYIFFNKKLFFISMLSTSFSAQLGSVFSRAWRTITQLVPDTLFDVKGTFCMTVSSVHLTPLLCFIAFWNNQTNLKIINSKANSPVFFLFLFLNNVTISFIYVQRVFPCRLRTIKHSHV